MSITTNSFPSIAYTYTRPVDLLPMGDIGSALKMWKQNMKANEKIDILKSKKEFIKPSVLNRKKKSDAEFNQWLLDKHYAENNGGL